MPARSEPMIGPAGVVGQCLQTKETTPLDPGRESTLYAPGIGVVTDGPLVLISYTKR
jgi:hypothetical protein